MKAINVMKAVAVVAMASVAAVASAESKTKVFVSSYMKPNYAVVSVVPTEESCVYKMEVTDRAGSMIYVSKRLEDISASQFLLDVRNLHDGEYTVSFYSKDGVVTKNFSISNNKVVR